MTVPTMLYLIALICFLKTSNGLASYPIVGGLCTSESRRAKCSTDFKGIYAYSLNRNCDFGICVTLTLNECTACLNSEVVAFTEEKSLEDKVFCDNKVRPMSCPKESKPVCALSEGENTIYGFTARNPCIACKDPRVSHYYAGGGCDVKVEEEEGEEENSDEEDEILRSFENEINESDHAEIIEALNSIDRILGRFSDLNLIDRLRNNQVF